MPAKSKRRRYLPVIVVSVVVVSVGGGAVALVRSFLGSPPSAPPQLIEQVRLIRPPPPPPDQPPPPPPPDEKVEIQQPEQPPDPTPNNEPPPSTQLGLDAEGGAGGDAFGLVGNKGGRDLTALGGSAFAWYAGLLKDQVLNELNGDDKLRRGEYSITLRAWLREDGSVARFEILKGSGDATRDRRIAADLARLQRLPQSPPSGMPDTVSLQVVSRG
jgi:periplasmic protein TonB